MRSTYSTAKIAVKPHSRLVSNWPCRSLNEAMLSSITTTRLAKMITSSQVSKRLPAGVLVKKMMV